GSSLIVVAPCAGTEECADGSVELGDHRAVGELGEGACKLAVVPLLIGSSGAETREDIVSGASVEQNRASVVQLVRERNAERAVGQVWILKVSEVGGLAGSPWRFRCLVGI